MIVATIFAALFRPQVVITMPPKVAGGTAPLAEITSLADASACTSGTGKRYSPHCRLPYGHTPAVTQRLQTLYTPAGSAVGASQQQHRFIFHSFTPVFTVDWQQIHAGDAELLNGLQVSVFWP